MKAWGEEKVWHKLIMNRWCDMWKCETWQREESKKKKRKLSGANSAWLLTAAEASRKASH